MKVYASEKLRNVVVLGHSGCGKSNLIEAAMYTAKITNKISKPNEKVNMTYSMSLTPIEYNGYKYNFLDTPGYFDFQGDVVSGIKASDISVVVIDGTTDIQVGTEKSLELADNTPKIIFINKVESEKIRYNEILDELREMYKNKVVPMYLPVYENKQFTRIQSILDDEITSIEGIDGAQLKESLIELVAESDDELLDKYFSGEELTMEEIHRGLKNGVANGDIIPVLCGSTINNIGTEELLDAIQKYVEPEVSEEEVFKGIVFKTVVDPFIGKISYIRVMQGELNPDSEIYNLNKSEKERVSNIYTIRDKEQIELDKACCGEIIALTKLNSLQTGDTISSNSKQEVLESITFAKPQIYFAIEPKNKGDEEKISLSLNKIVEEDPTIHWYRNVETKQALVGGQGELHINYVKNKLKDKFGVDVELNDIKVAYRETIKGKADVQGKHKKQSGGHGQYGDVKIRFERSQDSFEFTEEIFGGSVPKQYIPAVEKGLRDSMTSGMLAGFPVTNIKAILYDGSYHDVDSSEMAFKLAANIAFKKGIEQANPVLLEPIMNLKIVVPEEYMGDVMGDINKKRGKILGMEHDERGKQVIYAEAPQAETFKYAIDLRSMTQGRGYFEMEFERYEEVPQQLASKIIEQEKSNK